jgi:hypothetical protein
MSGLVLALNIYGNCVITQTDKQGGRVKGRGAMKYISTQYVCMNVDNGHALKQFIAYCFYGRVLA